MAINGVNILVQEVIFKPAWFGRTIWIVTMTMTFFFALLYLDTFKKSIGFVTAFCFICFMFTLILTTHTSNRTVFNTPSKIKYTIEVIDDNAWKELGPNYTIKEKVYENKEIYIVEGDYVE